MFDSRPGGWGGGGGGGGVRDSLPIKGLIFPPYRPTPPPPFGPLRGCYEISFRGFYIKKWFFSLTTFYTLYSCREKG